MSFADCAFEHLALKNDRVGGAFLLGADNDAYSRSYKMDG